MNTQRRTRKSFQVLGVTFFHIRVRCFLRPLYVGFIVHCTAYKDNDAPYATVQSKATCFQGLKLQGSA